MRAYPGRGRDFVEEGARLSPATMIKVDARTWDIFYIFYAWNVRERRGHKVTRWQATLNKRRGVGATK